MCPDKVLDIWSKDESSKQTRPATFPLLLSHLPLKRRPSLRPNKQQTKTQRRASGNAAPEANLRSRTLSSLLNGFSFSNTHRKRGQKHSRPASGSKDAGRLPFRDTKNEPLQELAQCPLLRSSLNFFVKKLGSCLLSTQARAYKHTGWGR
jgi:hypothetical protein